jgi:hypothetical protein
MDWPSHFPTFTDPDPAKTTLSGARKLVKDVEVVDIGCGFGGLLVGLAPLMSDTLMVGKYWTYFLVCILTSLFGEEIWRNLCGKIN